MSGRPRRPLPPREYDSVKQFAARYGLAEMTVRRGIDDGQFLAVNLRGAIRLPVEQNRARIEARQSRRAVRRGRPALLEEEV